MNAARRAQGSDSITVPRSFISVVHGHAATHPDRVALINPGAQSWTYRELALAVEEMRASLVAHGVVTGDRVALVSRGSAESVASYLAITAANTAVPLNPAYREDEFDFAFQDLGVRALVVADAPEAEQVAQRRGIPILQVSAAVATSSPTAPRGAGASLDDIAIVLHTSGTTSRPKIVPLTHANIITASDQIRSTLALTADDRCVNVMPTFHIHGLSAVLSTLIAGGSVVCPSEFVAPDFFELMRDYAPTWYTASPAIHQSVFEAALKQPESPVRHSLRFIRSASSPMPPTLIRDMEQAFQIPFLEAYGMTETSPIISSNPLPPAERKIGSVGRAAGCQVAIMTDAIVLPEGETGEIVVRGANVMREYENDPGANAAQFSDGWFRTGDLGRLDADGYLFVTGRLKEIINRGGEKISPPEVDKALLSHTSVAAACAFPVPHPKLGEEVAALVVLKPDQTATARELQEHVAVTLADFKVPRHIVFRDAIPLGSTGKVVRSAMAQHLELTEFFGKAELSAMQEFSLARSPEEEILAGIWEEVLHVERISIHEDFFSLGGDSVLAAQVLTRGNDALGSDLSFLDFFESPTIAELAARSVVDQGVGASTTPVHRAPDGAVLPLSIGQHALLVMQLLDPSDGSNNVYRAVRMRGPLDHNALVESLSELVQRHDSLRTTFPAHDGNVVRNTAPFMRLKVPVSDLAEVPEAKREAVAKALIERDAKTPFDLEQGPMFRARLVKISELDHILLLTMHHIMVDGWSIGILWSELEVLYEAFTNARKSPLPQPVLRYGDYAYWQRERLQGEYLESLNAYWKARLSGAPQQLNLPFDFERPPMLKHTGARLRFEFGADIATRLKTVARGENATLFMALLGAFSALMMHYSDQDDVVVGGPISGRERPELEGLIGYFSNSLALRTRLDGDPNFLEVIRRIRTTVLEAHAHRELPFASVVAAVGDTRVMNRNPLFQPNFRLRNIPASDPAMVGLDVAEIDMHNGFAKFELAFELWESTQGLTGFTEFSTELFEAPTIAAMVGKFEALLSVVADAPELALSEVFRQLVQAA